MECHNQVRGRGWRCLIVYGCTVTLGFAVLMTTVSGEVFTSSLKVERMVVDEENLLNTLKGFIEEQYGKLQVYTHFLQERLREVKEKERTETLRELRHPNAVYIHIKKFASEYYSLLGDHFQTFIRTAVESVNPSFLAGHEDMHGAKLSLIRLQEVFKLKASDMTRGDYLGYQGPPLSYADAYEIGQVAFAEAKMDTGLEWLNVSLTYYYQHGKTSVPYWSFKPSEGSIKALMGRLYIYKGEDQMAQSLFDEARKLDPESGDVEELRKELFTKPKVDPHTQPDFFANFSHLCSLENKHHVPNPYSPKIFCRYKMAFLPYSVYKEEILSVAPFASVIYNFTSDAESDHFKERVKDQLVRGKVGNDAESKVSNVRTSDLSWVWDSQSEIARKVAIRVQAVTGLDCSQREPEGIHSGEAFQVVNYGLGGHYAVHLDPLDMPSTVMQGSGERIATFLMYLSDVERGGSTVFTKVGVAVAPIKNMALFWYNYKPNHEKDLKTYHAGCPVMIGHKWISNKWIWTYGNTFRRRCGLKSSRTQLDIEPDMASNYGAP